jgi:uncharacterized protein YeaO (DUF488 family)
MKTVLRLSTFEVGTPAKRGQGLRIGVTRRPPRGVEKNRWVRDGYFDVWFPALAPSAKLLARFKGRDWDDIAVRKRFLDSYDREILGSAEGRQTVDLFARFAARTPISIGCFCADETRCHRSRLYEMIRKHKPGS